jgi:hypothetical protein
MAAISLDRDSVRDTAAEVAQNPALQAFWILRVGLTVAPILFGLDKFANWLVDWPKYLAPQS